jgi:hypothetical protein
MNRATIDSWNNDKAVQDNIVECWLCVDCGVNTAPGVPDGPQLRLDIALNGQTEARYDRNTEVYHVKDAIWEQAGMRPWNGCLCIGCLERRIGRQLRPKDFASHDKVWRGLPCTDRRGFATVTVQTADGLREVICDLEDAPRLNGAFVSAVNDPLMQGENRTAH